MSQQLQGMAVTPSIIAQCIQQFKKGKGDGNYGFTSDHLIYGGHRLHVLLSILVPTTPACTWWNRPEEDLSSGKSESTHPSRTVVKSIEVFYGVESVVRGNADSLLN